jgi:uncharacterized protein
MDKINKKYFVKGMHCKSCEILIEQRLRESSDVSEVKASLSEGTIELESKGNALSPSDLDKKFKAEGYEFSYQPFQENNLWVFAVLVFVVGTLLIFSPELSQISSKMQITESTPLGLFFIYGLIAGISSCSALLSGMVLSLAKKKKETGGYPVESFLLGRVVSYTVFGFILGLTGTVLKLSPTVSTIFVIIVSIFLVLMGLEMMGVSVLSKLQLSLPKKFTIDLLKSKTNSLGTIFGMGFLTFFLPCGFTLTAAGISATVGNPIRGALILLFFVLGTIPPLYLISFIGKKFISNPKIGNLSSKIAGIFIIVFALINAYHEYGSLNISFPSNVNEVTGNKVLPNNEIQLIKMNANSRGYSPSYFKVKAGVPVRWEITDTGTSGCTNAVIANGLFSGQVALKPGQTSTVEFTPTHTGSYTFSCWMGMIRGTIEVVE